MPELSVLVVSYVDTGLAGLSSRTGLSYSSVVKQGQSAPIIVVFFVACCIFDDYKVINDYDLLKFI